MSTLLQIGFTNALIASLLAACVWCVARRLRHPVVVHVLWIIVLLKLFAPPVVQVRLPRYAAAAASRAVTAEPRVSAEPPLRAGRAAPTSQPIEPDASGARPLPSEERSATQAERRPGNAVAAPPSQKVQVVEVGTLQAAVAAVDWSIIIVAVWLTGSAVLLVISGERIWRFHRLVRITAEPSPKVQQLSNALAAQMQLRSPVQIRLTAGAIPPLLWSLGHRHVILVPSVLAEQLDERELEAVLAHELAHVKRRDYLVRWIELAAVIMYWWLPTVWWVRRQLREAEETACDAMVMATLPGRRRAYAEALVFTVESLAAARPLPIIASGLGEGRRLIRRIERLADRSSPRLSRLRQCCLAAIGLFVLPLSVNLFDAAAEERPNATGPLAVQQGQDERPAPAPAAEDPLALKRRQAIDRGIAFLRNEQAADGTWSDLIGFDGGMTALCTLGLLDAGVPPTDETVAQALAWLRENEPEKTYVVSLVTRAYARAGLPEDRGRIKRNADWLASAMINRGDFRGCWGYTAKEVATGDNSNAHYAILGLDAAETAGVEVPENVWQAALEYWIAAQDRDGSWGYKPGVSGTGSMTASGITAIAIILNRADFIEREDARASAKAALGRAFAWLVEHYSITGNPVPEINRVWERWHYYYLDALAHGCAHADLAMIEPHDWRRDMTELLLKEQQLDGSWSGKVPENNKQMATAFALLILSITNVDFKADAAADPERPRPAHQRRVR